MEKNKYDIFVNQSIYPKPEVLFGVNVENIDNIKDNSLIVLDTNALLVPYLTGSDSLSEVEKVYRQLIEVNRLIIPDQVAREFAKNRPRKLEEIFQQLSRKQSRIENIQIGNYPLLEGIIEYGQASDLESEINEKLKEYRNKIGTLVKKVKSWNWDDPVSKIYRELFTEDVIHKLSQDKESIEENLHYRYIHKIPPG